jgi:hypothetical protein
MTAFKASPDERTILQNIRIREMADGSGQMGRQMAVGRWVTD